MTARSGRLVIGLGNPDCGDDAVGRLVARWLRGKVPADVAIKEQNGDAAELVGMLRGADCVFLVDAAVSGAPVGTIRVLDCTAGEVPPPRPGASSHGLGLAEAIALASRLDGLPRVCRVYTVEGVAFAPGAAISPEVAAAAEALAARLMGELRHAICKSLAPRNSA